MTAAEVKAALMLRHPAYDAGLQGPGQWTCVAEWHNIDLLCFNAWASGGPRYGRVGYEVKVSRSDYRRELLKPSKRAGAVAFCHEFYFAVPKGLLKDDEVAYKPTPELADFGAYRREHCPGYYGTRCVPSGRKRTGIYRVRFGSGYARSMQPWRRDYDVTCPTCEGKGYIAASLAERIAPYLWVPADVGLIEVSAGGCRVVRNAPRRETKPLHEDHVALLVRHVSFRPDPRHRQAA